MSEKILYKDLSYKIVGCVYKVYNALGPGHREDIYHKALEIEFKAQELQFVSKKKLKIKYADIEVGIYEPDFIVEDKIILEIKSVLLMPKVFELQLYHYLKGSDYRVGYIINFGSDKIDIRRRIS
jgi:GxxExxY protein